MKKKLLIIFGVSLLFMHCTRKQHEAKLDALAMLALQYEEKITTLEQQLNPTNIDEFITINDAISATRQQADSAIKSLFSTIHDTIFLRFTQTKNKQKIAIEKVWVSGASYNEVYIQARVKALDHSSFMGPYTSLTIIDTDGARVEVGGGVGANADIKLQAGEQYLFSGKIDNLHLLGKFKLVQFDEDIKKW